MKVLIIAFDSEELSIRLASALAKKVEVYLMLSDYRSRHHLKWLSPRVNFLPFEKPRLRQPLKQFITIRKIIQRINYIKPDVIHFQKGHLWFNLALVLMRQYPLVISIHDPRHHMGDKATRNTPQRIMDLAYRRADRVIAHNEQMKDIIIKELHIPEEIISIVPLIERGDPNAQKNVDEIGNQVLFFGRIWEYKGLRYFIEAEPLVSAIIPDVKFVIAGRGDDLTPYQNIMANPEKFIIHNEFVSYEKRAALFRQASVVVLPYIEATQSGVIPVAYTFSKPVIATKVGGLSSQVDHGVTGYLLPPGDVKALGAAIVRLMKDKELRRRLGENGRRKLEGEWSAGVVAQKTIPVYRSAIKSHLDPKNRENPGTLISQVEHDE